jgi:uncharacterized membrane protein
MTLKYAVFIIFLVLLVPAALVPAAAFPDTTGDRAEGTARALEEKGLSPLLVTGLVSMVPVFELRGGIPVGVAALKQNPFIVYIIAVIFNLLPVIPVLLLLNPVKKLLENVPVFRGFFNFLTAKAEKNKRIVEKYEELGLMLFVAVPLPVTGAWTGSLIAVVMGLKVMKSFLFITLGVMIAGIIVTFLTLLGRTGIALAAVIIAGFVSFYTVKIVTERNKLSKKGEK